jgi:hypothetical protein
VHEWAPHYKDKMDAMQPGDLIEVQVPEHLTMNGMQKAMATYACKMWGAQSHVSSVDSAKRTVQLIRAA